MIRWNGYQGNTDIEIAQERADLVVNEIQRPARNIQVISDEEWDKWVEEAREASIIREKAENDELVRQRVEEKRRQLQLKRLEAYEDELARDTNRDKSHRQWYEAFFNQFHDPEDENQFTSGAWKEVYGNLAWFLVKLDAAYHWTHSSKQVSFAHRLRVAQKYLSQNDVEYFTDIVTKKDPKSGKQIPYSQALKSALEEKAKGTAPSDLLVFAPKEALQQLVNEVIDSESIRLLLEEEASRE